MHANLTALVYILATPFARVSVLEGGPLGGDKYKIAQFHLHWGKTSSTGSEHTVDGKMYSSEVNIYTSPRLSS